MKTTKIQERRSRIIEFLIENGASTKEDIMNALDISCRTLERDFNEIGEEGKYRIESIVENKKHKHKIVGKEYVDLDEEEILSLPILFNLMNIQKELESVLWLKYVLNKHYGIDESDWEKETYFSSPSTEWKHEREVLEVSVDIIRHIKKGNVLTFKYKPVTPNRPIENVVVAPLQIRYYDGRYYLIGAIYSDDCYNLKNLKVMAIDQIRNWTVKQFTIDENKITFDYKDFARKTDLKNYFKYSVGVVVPEDKNSYRKIRIRFKGWAKSYVKNKKIHLSQRIIKGDNNDYVDVEIEVYDTFELDFVLGRFREFCEKI